jgi:hypothetical protein
VSFLQDTNGASHDDLFKAAWKWTTSEPSRASLCEDWQKIVPVPDNMNVKELVALTQGRMNLTDVLLMCGGGSQSKQPQREGSSQAEPSRGEAGTGAASAEGAPSKLASQQRKSSTALDSGLGDAAAAGGDPMVVDTVAVKKEKGVNGIASSAQLNTSAAPQGTLSSFDPLSGQPTPTSKAALTWQRPQQQPAWRWRQRRAAWTRSSTRRCLATAQPALTAAAAAQTATSPSPHPGWVVAGATWV